jgi:hypothetical protein
MYKGKGNTQGYTERRRPAPSREQLARDIAHSIIARIDAGRSWSLSEYCLDTDDDMRRMVCEHLEQN